MKPNKTIPIVMMTDDNYIIPTAVALESLYDNKKNDTEYKIYILGDNLQQSSVNFFEKLTKYNFSVEVLIVENPYKDFFNKNPNMSCTTFLKFDIPFLLPNYEKILYLDGDTIILKDLSDLFAIDLENNYLGMVLDYHQLATKQNKKLGIDKYYNAGVMLFNAKKFRDENIHDILGKTYEKNSKIFTYHDQDTFNVVLNGNIKELNLKYNWMVSNLYFRNSKIRNTYHLSQKEYPNGEIAIVHLTTRLKPWKYKNVKFSKEWMQYFYKSKVKDQPLKLKCGKQYELFIWVRSKLESRFLNSFGKIILDMFNGKGKAERKNNDYNH